MGRWKDGHPAPERVLEMCKADRQQIEAFLQTAISFAAEGMRVLAFAWKEAPAGMDELTHHEAEKGLLFAGLQGMIDPPRSEVHRGVTTQ